MRIVDLNEWASEDLSVSGAEAEEPRVYEDVELADDELNPEEAAALLQLRSLVKKALVGFEPRERTLLQRHYFEGDHFDDVARELGVSKSWASRLQTRAVGQLAKMFGR